MTNPTEKSGPQNQADEASENPASTEASTKALVIFTAGFVGLLVLIIVVQMLRH
ncbi:MAG: hypothetical protein AB7E80_05535 [Hyphomicrobiaceae bacterium]